MTEFTGEQVLRGDGAWAPGRAMTAEHTRRALLRLRAQPEGVRGEG